jgi:hypothetical protein
MNEVWTMMLKGAGAGAWVVGAGLVLAIALPVFGVLFAVIAKVLGAGNRNGGGM